MPASHLVYARGTSLALGEVSFCREGQGGTVAGHLQVGCREGGTQPNQNTAAPQRTLPLLGEGGCVCVCVCDSTIQVEITHLKLMTCPSIFMM